MHQKEGNTTACSEGSKQACLRESEKTRWAKGKEQAWGGWEEAVQARGAGLWGWGGEGAKAQQGMTTNVVPRVWPVRGAEWVGGRDQPEWELEFSSEMQPLGILWFVFVFYLAEKHICHMCCAGQWLGFYNSCCQLYSLFKRLYKKFNHVS